MFQDSFSLADDYVSLVGYGLAPEMEHQDAFRVLIRERDIIRTADVDLKNYYEEHGKVTVEQVNLPKKRLNALNRLLELGLERALELKENSRDWQSDLNKLTSQP